MNKMLYILAVAMIFTFSACEDLIDIDPVSEISADSYYENDEQVNTALIGVYNGMQTPLEHEWRFTEIRSDNAWQNEANSTSTDRVNLTDLDMFRPLSTMDEIYEYWYATYQNITSANRVISEVGVVSDEDLRIQYEGEARFIRAYHYFNLVRLFGPVFLVEDAVGPVEAKDMTRSSVDDVYDLIIEDLLFGSEKLPEAYENSQKGRVTKWAAKTLLAKVYMTLQDYPSAKPLLEDVVYNNNGNHDLVSNYEDVFSIGNEMNEEIIFAVRYKAGGYGLGSPFGNYFAASQSGSSIIVGDGKGYNYPTTDLLVNGYEDGDARKSFTIKSIVSGFGPFREEKFYINKFISSVTSAYDAENDFPILRYADAVLLLAEVYNDEGSVDKALIEVNKIRERAELDPIEDDLTQEECALVIERERRVELAFENQRWFDLVRTGRAQEVIKNQIEVVDRAEYDLFPDYNQPKYDEIIQDWQLLLPIPQIEIDTNNKIDIVQNEGY